MMKHKWAISHIILLILALASILYWLFLTMLYGTLTFLNLFLYGGCLLLFFVLFVHWKGIVLHTHVPLLYLRLGTALLIASFSGFILTESTIIYSGYHESEAFGDTIMVLGAGLIDGDQISLSLSYRLERAYEEYLKHPDSMILVSGGQGEDETISEAAAMKQWLVEHNVPADQILMEDRSRNTSQNFAYSLEILQQHGISSRRISLVTNRFHMKRAAYLAEYNGFEIACKPAKDLAFAQLCQYTRECFGLWRAYLFHY